MLFPEDIMKKITLKDLAVKSFVLKTMEEQKVLIGGITSTSVHQIACKTE